MISPLISQVLYHIWPYFLGIFPSIGLIQAFYMVSTSNLGSWVMSIDQITINSHSNPTKSRNPMKIHEITMNSHSNPTKFHQIPFKSHSNPTKSPAERPPLQLVLQDGGSQSGAHWAPGPLLMSPLSWGPPTYISPRSGWYANNYAEHKYSRKIGF